MEIIVINGYANSGKTSSIDYLKENYGFECFSTSEYLHQTAALLLNIYNPKISVEEFRTILKNKIDGLVVFGNREYNSRDFLIKLAEGVLVPVFSRRLFSSNVIWNILETNPDKAIIETIGGPEWEILKSELERYKFKYTPVIIRSRLEKAGADIRELIEEEGTVIINNNRTFLDLYSQLDKVVVSTLVQKQELKCS